MASTTHQAATVDPLDADCERILTQFEQSRESQPIEFARDALSKVDPRFRSALVTELARIELERNFVVAYLDDLSWKPSGFVSEFLQLFSHLRHLDQLAFEHYRLARMHGQSVSRQQVAGLYGVTGEQWKELPLSDTAILRSVNEPQYPRVGETFCGYPLIAELGRGALARVYLARQTDLASRLVVLKITGRLNAESDKLARLQHTNIVPVYSQHRSTTSQQLYAICMPYLGSLTLADLLTLFAGKPHTAGRVEELISTLVARRCSTLVESGASVDSGEPRSMGSSSTQEREPSAGSLPETRLESQVRPASQAGAVRQPIELQRQLGYAELAGALHDLIGGHNEIQSTCRLMEGIISGIAFAHSIGIVHRDLKPENVLIANDGRPVILDFNLSDEPDRQQPNIIGGTLPYMSWQQLNALQHGGQVSTSDDVFAIGVIFYRLLTGQLPYPGGTIDQCSRMISERKQPAQTLRSLAPRVPPSLSSLVMKCLAPDDRDRYPSAVQLHEDLTLFLHHQPLRHASDRSLAEHIQRFVRRNPVVTSAGFIIATALVLLCIVAIGWWWTRERADQLAAQLRYRQLMLAVPELVSQLHGPYRDMRQLRLGIQTAQQHLDQWQVTSSQSLREQPISRLSLEERQSVRQQLGQLAFSMAGAEGNLALLDNGDPSKLQHQLAARAWNQVAATLAPQLASACRFQQEQFDQRWMSPRTNHSAVEHAAQKQAANDDPPLAKLLLAQQAGDIASWLHWADVMVRDQPEDSLAWFNLGSAHFTAARFERAWSCFDVAAKLQRNSRSSLFWRGVCSYQLGEHARALSDFEQCMSFDANWASARHNRALAAFALHKIDDAIADTNYLIDNQLAGPRVWLLRAQIHTLRGEGQAAQQDRAAALTADCQSADDWVAIGVQKLPQNAEEALAAFTTARNLEPNNLAALQNSVHALSERLDRTAEAIELLDRIILLRPNDAGQWATRGILRARMGQKSNALADANRVATLQPKAIEMLQVAGIYAWLIQDLPSNSEAQSGDSNEREQWKKTAIDWLKRALVADPRLVRIVESDPDTAAIHHDPSCQSIITNAKELIRTK